MKWETNFDLDGTFLGYAYYIKKLNFAIYVEQEYEDKKPYFKLYIINYNDEILMDSNKTYDNADEAKEDGGAFLKKYLKKIIKKLERINE